jgi:hypothetical protein
MLNCGPVTCAAAPAVTVVFPAAAIPLKHAIITTARNTESVLFIG